MGVAGARAPCPSRLLRLCIYRCKLPANDTEEQTVTTVTSRRRSSFFSKIFVHHKVVGKTKQNKPENNLETRNTLDCTNLITLFALFSPTYLLNLIELEIAPLDSPTPKTPP